MILKKLARLLFSDSFQVRIGFKIVQIVSIDLFDCSSRNSHVLSHFQFLSILLITTLKSFKMKGSIEVRCPHASNGTRVVIRPQPNSDTKDRRDFVTKSREDHPSIFMMDFTIRYPFLENVIQEPVSCNDSVLPLSSSEYHGWMPRILHPNERLSVLFLTGVCIFSTLYAFLFSNANFNKTFLTDRDVVSEVLTSFLLSFLWFTSLVTWTAAVADLKHYSVFAVAYTRVCSEQGVTCVYWTAGNSITKLYLTLLLAFVNTVSWVFCLVFRMYLHSGQVIHPVILTPLNKITQSMSSDKIADRISESLTASTLSLKFSRIEENDDDEVSKEGEDSSQGKRSSPVNQINSILKKPKTRPEISISTIEDKIEYQKPGTEKYVRFFE